MNVSSQRADGLAELVLPAGLSLAAGNAREHLVLEAGASSPRVFRATGSFSGRPALELVFRPSNNPEGYSRGRVFLSRVGGEIVGLTTAQAIASEAKTAGGRQLFSATRLPGPLEAPVKTATGDTSVRGRLEWYDYSGKLVTGPFVTVELVAADGAGKAVASGRTDRDGNWQLTVAGGDSAGKAVKPRFTMANERWAVKNSDGPYAWEAPAVTLAAASTVDAGDIVLPKGLPSSEAAWIHATLVHALDAFTSRNIDLSWWNQIGVNWPSDGDYYSGEVNLTEPHQWDVTGHEFGHAVFFTGTSSEGGGGQHKIDECYSKALAWSEGWATFFSAVSNLDRADPDAKFQFLVPRRAPIRIENVPDDVCKGETNEWRVSAALWDLYDTHNDGTDAYAVDFDRIWGWMRAGDHMASLSDFWAVVKKDLPASEIGAAKSALEQGGVSLP